MRGGGKKEISSAGTTLSPAVYQTEHKILWKRFEYTALDSSVSRNFKGLGIELPEGSRRLENVEFNRGDA